jgi:hypothetical protein
MRTGAFKQDDAHVFCREEEVLGKVPASRSSCLMSTPIWAPALCGASVRSSDLTG